MIPLYIAMTYGFKALDEHCDGSIRCRDYTFTVGTVHNIDGEIGMCLRGFHYCKDLKDVFIYYPGDKSRTIYAKIEDLGIDTQSDNYKSCSRSIRIVELLEGCYNTKDGKYWFHNGRLHRDNDRPAVILPDGTQEWFKHGNLHRTDDKPAVISADGTQKWYKDGLLHRDNDRPATIHGDGTQCWYQNGKLHRGGDQPAEIWADGTRHWYQHGSYQHGAGVCMKFK